MTEKLTKIPSPAYSPVDGIRAMTSLTQSQLVNDIKSCLSGVAGGYSSRMTTVPSFPEDKLKIDDMNLYELAASTSRTTSEILNKLKNVISAYGNYFMDVEIVGDKDKFPLVITFKARQLYDQKPFIVKTTFCDTELALSSIVNYQAYDNIGAIWSRLATALNLSYDGVILTTHFDGDEEPTVICQDGFSYILHYIHNSYYSANSFKNKKQLYDFIISLGLYSPDLFLNDGNYSPTRPKLPEAFITYLQNHPPQVIFDHVTLGKAKGLEHIYARNSELKTIQMNKSKHRFKQNLAKEKLIKVMEIMGMDMTEVSKESFISFFEDQFTMNNTSVDFLITSSPDSIKEKIQSFRNRWETWVSDSVKRAKREERARKKAIPTGSPNGIKTALTSREKEESKFNKSPPKKLDWTSKKGVW